MKDHESLDLLVLGTGPAATRVARRCAAAKWRVGVVDPKPFGGTCALRGCNPKKVLVRAAEVIDWARRMEGKGVRSSGLHINWRELIRFKNQFTEPVTESKEKAFADANIRSFHGSPRFIGQNAVNIDGRSIEARHVLIATGAVPMELSIEGREYLTTSDEFLDWEELPQRIVFVGGGYISFEFAHVVARAGADVTIIEVSERPLSRFDADLVDRLVHRSQQIGIDVRTHTEVSRIEKRPDGSFVLTLENSDGSDSIVADRVVHGAGRVPNIEGLELEAGGIEADRQGVHVNAYMQSVSNPAVYAAGDVVKIGMPALTPVANQQGYAVAKTLLEGSPTEPDYGPVPTVVYSVPGLAAVGCSEREAEQRGLEFEIKSGDWSDFSSMRKVGETHAAYKILLEKGTRRFLGAHLLAPDAAELINFFALAIKCNITADDFKSVLIAFPSFAADLRSVL